MNDAHFPTTLSGSRLFRAVFSMTLTQVLIVSAMFAIPVAAPAIGAEAGIDPSRVGIFTALVFTVGIWSTVVGGNAAARVGGIRVSQVCLVLSAVSLGLASIGQLWALILAAVALGCGLGPETPASTHLLARVVPKPLQPRLFSVRQTGNQFGAIAMSLFLPAMTALAGWRVGFAIVAATCLLYALILELDRRVLLAYDVDAGPRMKRRLKDALRIVRHDARLIRLGAVAVAFCATQICLNGFLVSYLVQDLTMNLITAGYVMAAAQTGGLFGRVGWGLVVERIGRVPYVLAGIGVAMTVSAALTAYFTTAWPFPALLAVAFVFGMTASGWNGIFLAEATRLAPAGRAGEVTGALTMIIFFGLVIGPLTFSSIVSWGGGYANGFLVLAGLALAGTIVILWRADAQPPVRA